MEEKVDRIKQYVVLLNSNIEQDKVFDFNVREMIDRILNYTNRNEVPVELERVLAKVIVNVYKKIENETRIWYTEKAYTTTAGGADGKC